MAGKKKEIVHVNIYKINAEKRLVCGPPAIWELEATVEVTYKDRTSELQYISTIDLGEAGWQVMSKSMNDFKDDEDITPYFIASWEDISETVGTPYEKAIAELDLIFQKVAVL